MAHLPPSPHNANAAGADPATGEQRGNHQDARDFRPRDGRAERGQRSAEALLQAARRAFAARGYAGASVRQIAGAAGVNLGLVRYHFGSKDKLYEQVIDRAMAPLRDRLVEAFASGSGLLDSAQRLADAYFDHLQHDRELPRLIQRALIDGDPRVLRVARSHLRPLRTALRALVAERGAPASASLDDMVTTLFGALVAPFLYAPLLSEAFGHDVLAEPALTRRRAHIRALIAKTLSETEQLP